MDNFRSNNHYWQSFHNSTLPLLIVDFNGKIVDLNTSLEKLFSRTNYKEGIIGKDFREVFNLYSPENKQMNLIIEQRLAKVIKGDILEPIELIIKKKDGLNIWVNIFGNILKIGEKKYVQAIIQDITDNKKMSEQIQQSEALYKSIIENLNEGFGIIDKNGMITHVNPKICEILGYTDEELKKCHFIDIIEQDFKELTLKEFELRKKGTLNKYELLLKNKNGNKIPVIISPVPIYDQDGQFNGAFASIMDISDQLKKEMDYKENYEKLEILSQIIIIGNRANDLQDLLNRILRLCLNLLKFDAGNIYLVNKDTGFAENVIHYGYPPGFIKNIEEINIKDHYYKTIFFEGKSLFYNSFENECFRKAGYFSRAIIPITKKDKIIGALNIVSRNTYNFSKFEKDLFQSIGQEMGTAIERMLFEERLIKSEEKYRNLFESSPNIILIMNTEGIIIDCNSPSEKLSGFKRSDLIGKFFLDLTGVPKENYALIIEDFKSVLKGGIPERDVKLYNKDGVLVWVHFRASLVNLGNEKLLQVIIQVIDDKKKAEEDLKRSEEKYRFITENMADTISVFNEKFQLIYANETQKKISDFTLSNLYYKNPIEFIHPDDKKKALNVLRNIKKKGVVSEIYRLRNTANEYIWMDVRAKTFKDSDGNLRYLLVSRDITERMVAEQRIKESEEKFRTLTEQSIASIIILQDNKHKYVNQRYADITGYSVDEILSWGPKDLLKAVHPDDVPEIAERLKQRLFRPSLEVHHHQLKGIKKTGEIFWAEIYSKIIIYEGRPADFVTLIDITEQKESEFKYQVISENASDLICIINKDLEIEYVNEKAYKKLLGYTKEDLLGKLDVSLIHPEDLSENYRIEKNALEQVSSTTQLRLKHKDGRYLWFEIRGTYFLDKKGKAKALLISRDISSYKEIEEKLKELNRLKTELLRRTSHELKTPLIAIKGNADLLLKLHGDKLDQKVISILKDMKYGCTRLENIIIDLLKSSQLESGKLKLNKTHNDLSFLIKFSVNEVLYIAEQRDQTIEVKIHEEIWVSFEKEKIHEVLSNLLINAIKNTLPDGLIRVKTELKNNDVVISIEDNGIGITPEEKEKLFTQFGKIERYGQGLDLGIEGTGLGLYISKKLVELHGGKIWAESEGRNKGAIFYFSLPLN